MEILSLIYKSLVEIKLYHHYFLDKKGKVYKGDQDLNPKEKEYRERRYNVLDWLSLVPESKTEDCLKNLGLVLRKTNFGFKIFTPSNAQGKVTRSMDSLNLEFGFTIRPEILSLTALPKYKNYGKYLFSNEEAWLHANASNSLSLHPPDYDVNRHYIPGEIIQSGTERYMAIVKVDNKNKAVNQPDYWRKIDNSVPYVNQNDYRTGVDSSLTGCLAKIRLSGNPDMDPFNLIDTNQILQERIFKIHLNMI